ncbi:MAG: hypothetical protein HYT93_00800 [Parcubacteria group bacterium]|nr:hypothetical protein [Parcubacteria group bacterium]
MPDSFKFSILAILIFCVGVFGTPAYAQVENTNTLKLCKKFEDGGPLHVLNRTKRYDSKGKSRPPIDKETIDQLGAEGYQLVSITVEKVKEVVKGEIKNEQWYVYWFSCGVPVKYQVIAPLFQGARNRVEELYRNGWHFVTAFTGNEVTWYYFKKPL